MAKATQEPTFGYHIAEIPKGEYGQTTKIQEELDELVDALNQKNKIMAMNELSDLYGAIRGFLDLHFPGFTMEDLDTMSRATSRAFVRGDRS